MTDLVTAKHLLDRSKTPYNSTYKKLAVQWLNEVLCFVSSSGLVDSLVHQNPPDRQARKRQQ